MSEQEPQSKGSKFLSWIDQRFIGPLVGALIAAIVGGRIVIQITGAQFNIGLLVLVSLIIFIVMGISFFLGMLYIFYFIAGLFTKRKTPLVIRIVANLSMVVLSPFWLKEWWRAQKSTKPPDESVEQMLAWIHKARENK